MENTSLTDIAGEILKSCLEGRRAKSRLVERLVSACLSPDGETAARAAGVLFRGLAEPLADRFEPRLCERYAEIFSEAFAAASGEWEAERLLARYRRVRRSRVHDRTASRPEHVIVLSRVTLGADVAVTSVILDGVRRRFRGAEIWLAGPRKNWDLFAGDGRMGFLEVVYPRDGTLRERVEAARELRRIVSDPESMVIDPDSRLTQLGLLPVCEDEDYYFFESRSYGAEGEDSLRQLAGRWMEETFGISGAQAYLGPYVRGSRAVREGITVSLGVGGNENKRLPDPFEARLLAGLARLGAPVVVDKGGGGEEGERVEAAVAASGAAGRIETWDGSFAGFAGRIARSKLYVGYDSAGQHVAAAGGTPLVTVFAGYPNERFVCRWKPGGRGRSEVVRAGNRGLGEILDEALAAAKNCLVGAGGLLIFLNGLF